MRNFAILKLKDAIACTLLNYQKGLGMKKKMLVSSLVLVFLTVVANLFGMKDVSQEKEITIKEDVRKSLGEIVSYYPVSRDPDRQGPGKICLLAEQCIKKEIKEDLFYSATKQYVKMLYKTKLKNIFTRVSQGVVQELFKEYATYMLNKVRGTAPLSKLTWCDCKYTRAKTRFYLILDLLNEIAKRDRNKKLDFVSLGSGSLLMEYLTVKGLVKLGFKNIRVYLIDPAYNEKDRRRSEKFVRDFQVSSPKGEKAVQEFRSLFRANKTIKITQNIIYLDLLADWKEGGEADIVQLVDPGTERCTLKKYNKCLDEYFDYFNLFDIALGVYKKAICKDYVYSEKKEKWEWQECERDEKVLRTSVFSIFLPYKGLPEVVYHKDYMPQYVEKFLLSYLPKYKGNKHKKEFIDGLLKELKNLIEKREPKKIEEGECFKAKITEVTLDSELGFYDMLLQIASKKSLLYYADDNKIYRGAVNIWRDRMLKDGCKILKPKK